MLHIYVYYTHISRACSWSPLLQVLLCTFFLDVSLFFFPADIHWVCVAYICVLHTHPACLFVVAATACYLSSVCFLVFGWSDFPCFFLTYITTWGCFACVFVLQIHLEWFEKKISSVFLDAPHAVLLGDLPRSLCLSLTSLFLSRLLSLFFFLSLSLSLSLARPFSLSLALSLSLSLSLSDAR